MDKTNYLNNRIAIVLGLIVMLLAASGVKYSFAANPSQMPDLRDEESTLTIETSYTDETVTTPISGVELTIYKVADLSVKNGEAKYTLTPDFSEADMDFNGMTASQSREAAAKFQEIAIAKGLEGVKAVSENGYANFGKVSHGMYLVRQTGATGQAVDYSTLESFLIMAPQPSVTNGGTTETTWNYDVQSVPKVVLGTYQPPPPPKEDEVKAEHEEEDEDESKVKGANTGDNIYTLVGSMVLLAAACLMAAFMIKRRRQND